MKNPHHQGCRKFICTLYYKVPNDHTLYLRCHGFLHLCASLNIEDTHDFSTYISLPNNILIDERHKFTPKLRTDLPNRHKSLNRAVEMGNNFSLKPGCPGKLNLLFNKKKKLEIQGRSKSDSSIDSLFLRSYRKTTNPDNLHSVSKLANESDKQERTEDVDLQQTDEDKFIRRVSDVSKISDKIHPLPTPRVSVKSIQSTCNVSDTNINSTEQSIQSSDDSNFRDSQNNLETVVENCSQIEHNSSSTDNDDVGYIKRYISQRLSVDRAPPRLSTTHKPQNSEITNVSSELDSESERLESFSDNLKTRYRENSLKIKVPVRKYCESIF